MEVEIGINGRLTSGFIVQMIRWHVVVVCCWWLNAVLWQLLPLVANRKRMTTNHVPRGSGSYEIRTMRDPNNTIIGLPVIHIIRDAGYKRSISWWNNDKSY